MGYIYIDPIYGSLKITNKSLPILKGKEKIFLNKQIIQKGKVLRFSKNSFALSLEDEMLLLDLKELRMKISKERKIPPYMIFNDESLKDMVKLKPLTKSTMLNVSGIGDIKFKSYGENFINIIKKHTNISED